MATLLPYLFLLFFFSSVASAEYSSSSALPLIREACTASRFPAICECALSDSTPPLQPNSTAVDIVLAALRISAADVETAKSKVQSIVDASVGKNANRTDAARNCIEMLSYSSRRLSAASEAVPKAALPDARIWTVASMIYPGVCSSGLSHVNDTDQVADAMSFIKDMANRTSDALAMVTALQHYGNDTSKWGPPLTERDGYWGPTSAAAAASSAPPVPISIPAVNLVPNVTVCKDIGCGYKTVQSAVDAAPEYSSVGFGVYIREGVYDEIVRIPFEKTNVAFFGDGMGKTVITGNLSAEMVGSTYYTATVAVLGDGFMATNLTFQNTAGPDAQQAVAFRSDSDHTYIESVEFVGHQDTLYTHTLRQLYKSCRIYGTVDFIFGNAAAIFQDSLILIVPRQLNPDKGETNCVSAQGRTDPAQPTGFVFYNCTVNGTAEYYSYYNKNPEVHKNYLGRPWKEYSRTVFIDSYLEVIVRPDGWSPWSGDFALSTLFYGEFESKGPGSNVTGRVPWSNQIPAEHLDVYSPQNFIQLGGLM